MKKLGILVIWGLAVLLGGCTPAQEATGETVQDELVWVSEMEPRYDISIAVPAQGEEVTALAGGNAQVYGLEGEFTLITQILQADSPEAALRELTGREGAQLAVITTMAEGMPRYDLSWVCMGENGLELCRGVVLDDGQYFYTATAHCPEDTAAQWLPQLTACLSGITLTKNEAKAVTAP